MPRYRENWIQLPNLLQSNKLKKPPGGDSHIKRTGLRVGNFEDPKERYQDPVLWAWFIYPLI